MKKIILMAIAVLFLLNISIASNDPAVENNNKIVKVITNVLQYPTSAKDNLIEGYVMLNFNVDESGKIHVNQIYSPKAELKEYVQNQLNKLVLDDLTPVSDQTYDLKIVFKLL
jgi:hypothetical protein